MKVIFPRKAGGSPDRRHCSNNRPAGTTTRIAERLLRGDESDKILKQTGTKERYFMPRKGGAVNFRGFAWGLAALALGLGGCGTTYPPAPAEIEAFDFWYLIGPGDSINIQVWRNPELSMTVSVRPDGKVTSPLVEDVPASGKTPTALAREMEKHLSKYVQSPVVTVIVAGFAGTYTQQVRVIGEAAKPAALPYRENMTLLDVMIAVGGITDFAAGNKASIVRNVGGRREQLGVRLIDLLRGGDLTANIAMRPGDVLVIPQSFF